MRNEQSNTPLHLAIKEACFANAMLLYKGCQDLCPEALNPYENGESFSLSLSSLIIKSA